MLACRTCVQKLSVRALWLQMLKIRLLPSGKQMMPGYTSCPRALLHRCVQANIHVFLCTVGLLSALWFFTFWGPAMESRTLKRSLCVMAWAGCCPVFGWVLESECGFTKQVELSRRREAQARDTIQELLTAGASVCQVRPSVYLSQRCKSFAQQHTP